MKFLILTSLIISMSLYAQSNGGSSPTQGQGSGSAPGHGAATNRGTHTSPAGLGDVAPTTTTRGTDINGAGTMGQDASPNSGMTNNRSTDVTGNDASAGTLDSSNQNPVTPTEGGRAAADAISKNKTQTGPYNREGMFQAQEAKDPSLKDLDSAEDEKEKTQVD